jgi:hypothetical protein
MCCVGGWLIGCQFMGAEYVQCVAADASTWMPARVAWVFAMQSVATAVSAVLCCGANCVCDVLCPAVLTYMRVNKPNLAVLDGSARWQ